MPLLQVKRKATVEGREYFLLGRSTAEQLFARVEALPPAAVATWLGALVDAAAAVVVALDQR